MTAFTLAERAHDASRLARFEAAYDRGERLAERTQEIFEDLLADPEPVLEAVIERDRATEMIVAILEVLPSINNAQSANVDKLLTFCRGLETEVSETLLFQARQKAEKECE